MATEFIRKDKIEKFIEDGLNREDKTKAFGHDAIEILTEIHFTSPERVRPAIEANWVLKEYMKFEEMKCSNCDAFYPLTEEWYYCPNCGAHMSYKRPKFYF